MNILVIAPHADDEVLGVGGTIAKYVYCGHNVYACIVTCGHSSMFTEDVLKKIRIETIEAHSFLGIKETIFLEYPAVMLHDIEIYKINASILDTVNKVKPEIVFIPHYGDMHIDHGIVAQASMVALRPIGENKVKSIYSYETLSETEWNIPHTSNAFIPNTWIDISGFLNKKIKAISKFGTQIKSFPHPRSIGAIKSLAGLRGSTVGVEAAEAFSLVRQIL